jgi:hypothetical protein
MEYQCEANLNLGKGKNYRPGDKVEMDPKEAKPLQDSGVLAKPAVVKKKPAKKAKK